MAWGQYMHKLAGEGNPILLQTILAVEGIMLHVSRMLTALFHANKDPRQYSMDPRSCLACLGRDDIITVVPAHWLSMDEGPNGMILDVEHRYGQHATTSTGKTNVTEQEMECEK